MDYTKKNLKFGTRVRVVKTNSTMDGLEGKISGIAMIHIFDTMIVSLRDPIDLGIGEFQSFIMPETCLEAVPCKTLVFKVTEKNRSSKRVSMEPEVWESFVRDVQDGLIEKVEIRVSKTNELLHEIPGCFAERFYLVENPYAPDYGYRLVSYGPALKSMAREQEQHFEGA